MAVDLASTEGMIIRRLIPLASLPSAPLKDLCDSVVVEEIQDDFLFKKGDTDHHLFYLISGIVSLQAQGLLIDQIDAKTESARFALAHQIPRKVDALAKGLVRFLRLDADIVNNPPPLVYREDDNYLVCEEPENDTQDWMTALLKLPIFRHVTPGNLQKVLISLENIQYKKGELILEQGIADEHYYLIKSGTCVLTHKASAEAEAIEVARLGKGNTLGEDALIFDSPRTETITALTDVELLRLNKRQFISLIKEPALKFVDLPEMQRIMATNATLLDIRSISEYRERYLKGSINIAFSSLKSRLKMLPLEKPIIIIGNSDKASEAAAFFLIKHKYDTLILRGGINSINLIPENEKLFGNVNDLPKIIEEDPREQSIYLDEDLLNVTHKDFEARIATLELENEMLRKNNTVLKQRYRQLQADKDNVEKECRMLTKRVEKLTQVLDKFKVMTTK